MRSRVLLVLALVVVLAQVASSQGAFEDDLKVLEIDENQTLNATLYNDLPVSDQFTLQLSGEAISGLVNLSFRDSDPDISCNQEAARCDVSIGPQSGENVTMVLTGISIGQADLRGEVNSSVTHLSSSDDIRIRVEPFFPRQIVSAPGIGLFQILVLALAGAAIFTFRN